MSALPPTLEANPELDTWIRIERDGTVIAYTGKVELGQGIVAALTRIAAEELDVDLDRVRVRTADTAHPLDERYTTGSRSMSETGLALRQAAAEARARLLELASDALCAPVDELSVEDGTVRDRDGRRAVSYWELLGGGRFERRATGAAAPKPAAEHRIAGSSRRDRRDLRGIVTGETRYVHDLTHERMVHARVVRPPGPGSRLVSLDDGPVRALDGVLDVVRDGSFLGVVARREEQALRAADALRSRARWDQGDALPAHIGAAAWLREQPDRAFEVRDGTPVADGAPGDPPDADWTHSATYSRPYVMHGSIGASAAMALWDEGRLTVWTHGQGVFVLREALAAALDLGPERIRVRHVVGAGCYGHNGADDAAFDAVLLARAVPGRAVLLKWTRADEHQWEPYGPPGRVELRATLDDDGRISDYSHDVWGTTHVLRPMTNGTANLLAGHDLEQPPAYAGPQPVLRKEVGIHRNATPIYELPRKRIVKHFVEATPLRTSSLRCLGAYANVLAIESFMDELARLADANPIEFRERHLGDERAREVLRAAAGAAGWDGGPSEEFGRGTGIALARYKNSAAYAAVVVRLGVDDQTAVVALEHIWIAADCGEVVDPSGTENQLEGGALQSASWTLKERVTYDSGAVTSVDWDSYPILRFSEVPPVESVLLDRPGQPYLGVGEATQGPTAAAIANAVHDAVGFRLRDTPFTPERVRAAALAGAV